MTDRLKLSDLKGDANPEDVARVLMAEDTKKRIEELQRNIATLEKLAAERKGKPVAPLAEKDAPLGLRKNGAFKAISIAPSINKTPRGSAMVPVAYTTVQDLSNSVGVAKTVRFNGDPAYLLDSSTQPSCRGDEAGTGGGIRSGTVNGEVKPTTGSRSVRVEGKSVVRVGDRCTMNGGNNTGIFIAANSPSGQAPASAILTSNPALLPETSGELSWVDQRLSEVAAAIRNPTDGLIGAAKGVINSFADIGETLLKGGALKAAGDLEESAILNLASQPDEARTKFEMAASLKRNSDSIELPKLKMENAAEKGGDFVSTVWQLLQPVALAKHGLILSGSLIAKGKSTGSIKRAADAAIGSKAPVLKSTSGDGVSIAGHVGKHSRRLNVTHRSADEVNATFPKEWEPPYKPKTRASEFTNSEDEIFVRAHGENNMARSWMMKREAIEGLTAAEIKSKYALPELPEFISEVHVPAGTRIRSGIVNPVFSGRGDAIQYELLQRLPTSAFTNTMPIPK